MRHARTSLLGLIALMLALIAAPAPMARAGGEATTPAEPVSDIIVPVEHLLTEIDTLERRVERYQTSEEDLARQRLEIGGFIEGADLVWNNLWPQIGAVRSQIEKLGAPPGKDEPAEAPQIVAERQRLASLATEISGAMKTTELVQERARQLSDRVQDYRNRIFTGEIMHRSPSPLAPTTWRQLFQELPWAIRNVASAIADLKRLPQQTWVYLLALLGAIALLFAVATAIVRRLINSRRSAGEAHFPTFFERAANAGWVAPALALPAGLSLMALGTGLDGLGLITAHGVDLWSTVLQAAATYVAVWAVSRAILAPDAPMWRLADLSDATARRLTRTLTRIALVYAADLILKALIKAWALPLSVSVFETFLASLAIGLLLIELVRIPFEADPRNAPEVMTAPSAEGPAPVPPPTPPFYPRVLKLLFAAAGITIILASLLGYIALGRFVAGQVVVTGCVIAVVLLLHLAIQAMLGAPGSGVKPLSSVLTDRAGLDQRQSSVLSRGIALILDFALALIAIPLVLVTWGYTLGEALGWLKSAMFGFEIGQFRISFVRILLAVGLFLALLYVTRIVQRWLDSGLMTARVDTGIAHSIRTAAGYAGFTLAALAALSYGGLDITNIAIVAGALSVGIGFGLQSIVNNFVSGLILLVERPVKVGDLVAVGGREGRVRRIAVRSTEIETGDKASVIVPNSELISSAVTNFTHRNSLGRVAMRVPASYRSDPAQVREVLQRVLAECPMLLQAPPPGVSFDEFGANGFEFSISAVVADMGRVGAAKTDLRMRIVAAFREAGIEMPYAQHDVHLRDLDGVKYFLQRMAEEKARARAADAAGPRGPAITPDDKKPG